MKRLMLAGARFWRNPRGAAMVHIVVVMAIIALSLAATHALIKASTTPAVWIS